VVLDWLQNNKPDILAIQETKVMDSQFPAEAFKNAGYNVCFSGQKAYNGVAFVLKINPGKVSSGFSDKTEKSRLLRIRYGNVHIINTYVPQGRDVESEHYQYKLEWLRRLSELIKREYKPEDNVIWLGDLNIAPEPMDVHDPAKLKGQECFNVELTALLKDICSWGLYDVFRKHHPEPEQYTFFDYRTWGAVDRKLGWRLDHILATKPLLNRSTDSWIDLEPRRGKTHKPSDHTFLTAEFS